MKIASPRRSDFTALDLVDPSQIISRWPDADARLLTSSREAMTPAAA